MKFRLVTALWILLIFNNTICYSQIRDCSIAILDSNNIRKTFNKVTLQNFKSDILIYSVSGKIENVDLKNLISLKYNSGSKSSTGLIIGAAIGVGVSIAFIAILSGSRGGHPGLSSDISFGGALLGVISCATIGGIIGGIIQSPQKESRTLYFSGLTDEQKREEIKSIFTYYSDNPK